MAEILLERREGVAIITLNAPERRNSLTHSMARELVAVCAEVAADESIGAAVVRGAEGHFCAGAHRDSLAQAGADPTDDQTYRNLDLVYESFVRVGELPVPVVAAVRGAAVGAGVNLALAADLRVIATDARLIAGFMRIGIHPGGGNFVLTARTGGRDAAAASTLFGQEISGARAREIGMAWEALPDPQVETRAIEIASVPARDPALARMTVKNFRQELGPPMVPWRVALEAERATQLWSLRRRHRREHP